MVIPSLRGIEPGYDPRDEPARQEPAQQDRRAVLRPNGIQRLRPAAERHAAKEGRGFLRRHAGLLVMLHTGDGTADAPAVLSVAPDVFLARRREAGLQIAGITAQTSMPNGATSQRSALL